jgi:hypothetical protein
MSSTKDDGQCIWFASRFKTIPLAELERAFARVVEELVQPGKPVSCNIETLNEVQDTFGSVSIKLTLGDKIDFSILDEINPANLKK